MTMVGSMGTNEKTPVNIEKPRAVEELKKEFEDQMREEVFRSARIRRIEGDPLLGSERAPDQKGDMSIAKRNKFVNRIKRLSVEKSADPVVEEGQKLNLSTYFEEIIQALMDASSSMKLKDTETALAVIEMMCFRYGSKEFGDALLTAYSKNFQASSPISEMPRRRTILKVVSELLITALVPPTRVLIALKEMILNCCDANASLQIRAKNCAILSHFASRYGEQILDEENSAFRKDVAKHLEKETTSFAERTVKHVPSDDKLKMKLALTHWLKTKGVEVAENANNAVRQASEHNQQLLAAKGILDADCETKYTEAVVNLEKVEKQISSLCDALNVDKASLFVDFEKELDLNTVGLGGGGGEEPEELEEGAMPYAHGAPMWEDDVERSFYEVLPDLSKVFPDGPPENKEKEREKEEKDKDKDKEKDKDKDKDKESKKEDTKLQKFLTRLSKIESRQEADDFARDWLSRFYGKPYLKKLGVRFLEWQYGGKVHKSGLIPAGLRPAHARFLALLSSFCPDMLRAIASELKKEVLAYCAKKGSRDSNEYALKNIFFLGEMTKFGATVCPPGIILDLFQSFIDDFSPLHAELASHLCMNSGRFLQCSSLSAARMNQLVERMQRLLKNSRRVTGPSGPLAAVETAVETAIFHLHPPQNKGVGAGISGGRRECDRPVLERYIRRLVMVDLLTLDEEVVIRLVRKLPWGEDSDFSTSKLLNPADETAEDKPVNSREEEEETQIPSASSTQSRCYRWLKKAVLELNVCADFEHLDKLAWLLSGLCRYQEGFVGNEGGLEGRGRQSGDGSRHIKGSSSVDVVDSLLEEIQLTLERGDFRDSPLRVRQMKFLGELFNFQLVGSDVLFDTLYHLIGFGGLSQTEAGAQETAHKLIQAAQVSIYATSRADPRSRKKLMPNILPIAEEEEDVEGTGTLLPSGVPLVDPFALDEPLSSFFRVNLACMLLSTCGWYFSKGKRKTRMDRYLYFLQRYILLRAGGGSLHVNAEEVFATSEMGSGEGGMVNPVPLRIRHVLADSIEVMRGPFAVGRLTVRSLEDCEQRLVALLQAERNESEVPQTDQGKEDEQEENDRTEIEEERGDSGDTGKVEEWTDDEEEDEKEGDDPRDGDLDTEKERDGELSGDDGDEPEGGSAAFLKQLNEFELEQARLEEEEFERELREIKMEALNEGRNKRNTTGLSSEFLKLQSGSLQQTLKKSSVPPSVPGQGLLRVIGRRGGGGGGDSKAQPLIKLVGQTQTDRAPQVTGLVSVPQDSSLWKGLKLGEKERHKEIQEKDTIKKFVIDYEGRDRKGVIDVDEYYRRETKPKPKPAGPGKKGRQSGNDSLTAFVMDLYQDDIEYGRVGGGTLGGGPSAGAGLGLYKPGGRKL